MAINVPSPDAIFAENMLMRHEETGLKKTLPQGTRQDDILGKNGTEELT